MNKKLLVSSFIILALVLSVSVVSALSFGEFWNKITGKATAASTTTCTDSDGGINYDDYGIVTKCSGKKCSSYTDGCSGISGNIAERYCNGKNVATKINKCANGCKNGFCISGETAVNESCSSFPCFFDAKAITNDWSTVDAPPQYVSAVYPYRFELASTTQAKLTIRSLVWSAIPAEHGNTMYIKLDKKIIYQESKKDYNLSDDTKEISLGTLKKGKHYLEIYATPDPLHFAIDWFFVGINDSNQCTDSDGGKNYNIKGITLGLQPETGQYGTTIDYCSKEEDFLYEGYCLYSEHLGAYARSIDVYGCPNGCKDGVCVTVIALTNDTCIDSDGENYYTKGTVNVSGYNEDGSYWAGIVDDVCEGSNLTVPISINNLRERICDGTHGKDVFYTCPNGCSDGACITNANQTCTDSDGGKNYYVLGNATGADYSGGVNTVNDGCIIGGLHDGWLREAVCEGNVATWSDYKCSNGCVKGTCIN